MKKEKWNQLKKQSGNQLNQIKENKNSFEGSFKLMCHEIITWSYLELNSFQLIVQREILKLCFTKKINKKSKKL